MLAREIVAPPGPAGPFRLTLPIDELPPVTVVGLRLSIVRASGLTVRFAVFEAPPAVAVIAADVDVETVDVVMEKVAEAAPAVTVTVAGVWTLALFDDRATMLPPGGAAPLKVTVPSAPVPPTTDGGERVKPDTDAGLTTRVALWEEVPSTPLINAEVEFEVAEVVMVKDADV